MPFLLCILDLKSRRNHLNHGKEGPLFQQAIDLSDMRRISKKLIMHDVKHTHKNFLIF